MKQYVAVGLAVLAGAAVIEAALVPGVVLGGAVVLAPKVLPKLPRFLRRKAKSSTAAVKAVVSKAAGSKPAVKRSAKSTAARSASIKTASAKTGSSRSAAATSARRRPVQVAAMADLPQQGRPKLSLARLSEVKLQDVLPRIAIGEALAKTITYRIIVTALDFTTNYIIIGELATAAGLSSFNLVFGPLYYLGHEAVWNYLHGSEDTVELPPLTAAGAKAVDEGTSRFEISPALAKTITFRTFATIFDFTANFVVVGNIAEAMLLSASGFILGPFVYYGHEKAWEYYNGGSEQTRDRMDETRLLPAPA